MANKLANRVKVTVSGTPGTGTITLGSAVSGFMDFATAGVSNGNTVPYVIEDSNNWEIGVGTYTSSGTTLARTSITASSSGGTAISATSNAIVMISPLAADLQAGTAANNLVQLDGTGKIPALDGSLITGLNASNISSGTIAAARVPTLNQNTTGTAANVTGTVAVANGGTGLTSLTAGYIPYATATDTLGTSANFTYDGTSFTVGGNASRIKGDFSNATLLNRLFFQSNVTNGVTSLSAIPNGTATQSEMRFYNGTDPNNASFARLTVGGVGNTQTILQSSSNGTGSILPLCLYVGGSESMRIASDGSVGIGTTSPVAASGYTGLTINSGTSGGFLALQKAGNTYLWCEIDGSNNAFIGTNGSTDIIFKTNNTQRMRLDASGNLGLGVTPSAWVSSTKALEVGSVGSIGVSTNVFGLYTNAYLNSSFNYIYKNTNYATMYLQNANGTGQHQWHIAPSGTAGGTITFTQAMTLDASGNLVIGGTTANARLDVQGGSLRVNEDGAGTKVITLRSNYASVGPAINVTTNDPLLFLTNNTERARIDASGNLLVGTTTTGGGKVCVKNTPSSQWGIDFNECEISVANNSNATLPTGSGMVIINDPVQSGALGVYLFGGSTVVKVSSTDGTFVNPTTTPGAGTASIQSSSGTYRIYNNIGQTITFKVAMLRTRNSN